MCTCMTNTKYGVHSIASWRLLVLSLGEFLFALLLHWSFYALLLLVGAAHVGDDDGRAPAV